MAEAPLHRMAGTPVQVNLGGEEYTLSPLTVDDVAALEKWVQDVPLKHAKRVIEDHGDLFTEAQREKILFAAIEESRHIGLADMHEVLQSLEGTGFLLWCSLRQKHPNVKREDVLRLVGLADLDEIQAKLDEVSGLKEAASGES